MYRPNIGRVSFWLRQVNDTGEKSIEGIAATLNQYCRHFDREPVLTLKCADGLTPQGQIDPLTPVGVMGRRHAAQDAAAVKALLLSLGVGFTPVVVPRGLAGEAEFHAEIAQACGALMVDLEPYSGFWGKAPVEQMPLYCRALREAAPDAYLINQPDPRRLETVRPVEIASCFDAIMAQHYVGWTDVGWTNVSAEVDRVNTLRSYYRDVYVTVYGAGDTPLVEQFIRALPPEVLGINAFAFGPANATQLTRVSIAGVAQVQQHTPEPLEGRPPKPVPPPGPAPDWRQRYVEELRGIVQAADDDTLRAAVRKEDALKKLQELDVA